MAPPASGSKGNEEEFSRMKQPASSGDAWLELPLEEIGNLVAVGGKPAETLMNVVALIAKRFQTDVCSAYLLEPDRANLIDRKSVV